jgi:hypothetical protein
MRKGASAYGAVHEPIGRDYNRARMTSTDEAGRVEAPALRALVGEENARGGRLRITANTARPWEGPICLNGTDSRRRRIKAIGTEEFLCDMMRQFPSFTAS